MNRYLALTLVAFCAALANPSFADDITPTPDFVSTADRAQVQAQVQLTRGTADPSSITYDPLATFRSGLAREAVRDEFLATRHEVAEFTGEDSGSFALSRGEQASTRFAGSGSSTRTE